MDTTDRVVRIFISSTFRDMQAERDELIKRVFPQLRKLCNDRGVSFIEVELRWGVTDEEAAEGRVLPLCLSEIDRCRPFFLGLLGERYGWVPQHVPAELIEAQPWLAEHCEKSVTELEILHGVLNNPAMADRAMFYFRDPRYIDSLSVVEQADFIETDPERQGRLRALKQRILQSGLACHVDYPDPRTLGRWVQEHLTTAINKMYPLADAPDPLSREAAEHEAFARRRASVHIGREECLLKLDDHAAGAGQPLVVLGESGLGKSALLAKWAIRHRIACPDTLVLMHFIGGTPYSTDCTGMVRRVLAELKKRFNLAADIPEKLGELRGVLARWLHMAAVKGRVVLIFDGLNQLEDWEGALDLAWLPSVIPAGVRIVLSTLPGRPLDELKRRGWPTLTVSSLDPHERRQLIQQYLAQYRKKLRPDQIERVAAATQTASPLYLRALLDELRVFGIHERLDERIAYYLDALTVPELYELILQRWEEDYERERPGLVRDAMTVLWAARRGLDEAELLELLGTQDRPLLRVHWSPLSLAADSVLFARSGLIGFCHEYARLAVERRYMNDDESRRVVHRKLAEYFRHKPLDVRVSQELPWQHQMAEDWAALKDCVTQVPVINMFVNNGHMHEVAAYWRAIGNRDSLVDSLNERVSQYEATQADRHDLGNAMNGLAQFLQAVAHFDAADTYHQRCCEIRRSLGGNDDPSVAQTLNNRGMLMYECGRYEAQEQLLRAALLIWEKTLGPENAEVARGLNNLCTSLHAQGRYHDAEVVGRQALAIRERVLGSGHLETAQSLGNLAQVLEAQRKSREAEELTRRVLEIRETNLGREHPDVAVALNNLGFMLMERGACDDAEACFRRACSITERSLGSDHPDHARSLHALSLLAASHEDIETAERLERLALAINEAAFGSEHPHVSSTLTQLGLLLRERGAIAESEALLRRSLAISQKCVGDEHPDTAICMMNLGAACHLLGNTMEAGLLLQRGIQLWEQFFSPDDPTLSRVLPVLASIMHEQGDIEKADSLMRRVLDLCEKTFGSDHSRTSECRLDLAEFCDLRGNYEEAEALYRQDLSITIAQDGMDHENTAVVLYHLARVLLRKGNVGEARKHCQRALQIEEESLKKDDPDLKLTRDLLAEIDSS